MSFGKAKRFGDKLPIGPSPTDYTVLLPQKLPGAVIPKSDRFAEPKSPAVSDHGGSVKSFSSTPCFRTPTLPRKRKLQLLSPATKTKATELFNTELDIETLKDKIVECKNKDQFISELTEQIDDLIEKISELKSDKELLRNDMVTFQERYKELEEAHQITISTIYNQHDDELQEIKVEIGTVRDELNAINNDYEEMKQEKKEELNKLLDNMDSFQNVYKAKCEAYDKEIVIKEEILLIKENELQRLEEDLINMQRNHADEVERLTMERQKEVQDIEYEMLKSMTEMQRTLEKEKKLYEQELRELEEKSAKELQEKEIQARDEQTRIINESEARIRQVEENSKEAIILGEIQMKEKVKDIELTWALKLESQLKESDDILKECQEISEYSIIQCEVEKNKATNELQMKVTEIDDMKTNKYLLENKVTDLQCKIKELNVELETLKDEPKFCRKELETRISTLETQLSQSLVAKKAYDITINKTHHAIEAIKNRLINSDRDVEQLKSELENCELEKLEYEGKCNQLSEELDIVSKLNESYEVKVEDKIKEVEDVLLGKLEDYKSTVNESIGSYIIKIEQQNALLDSLHDQLKKQEDINSVALQLNSEYDRENSKFEVEVKEYNERCELLEKKNVELQYQLSLTREENVQLLRDLEEAEESEDMDVLRRQLMQVQEKSDSYYQYLEYYKTKTAEYEEEMLDMADIRKKYIEKSGKYDKLLQKYDDLQKKIDEQDLLIDPFRKQLEEYKQENSDLMSQVGETENEAKSLALKCAQLLGHQNQKQKIQHIIDLKNKNAELSEGLKEAKQKEKSQSKLIERLRNELEATKKAKLSKFQNTTDKENISSPNRTLNNSRVESPGPLRERN